MRYSVVWRLIVLVPLAVYCAEPITPIPQNISYSAAKAAIGKKLFFDPILSKDKTVACVSCHNFQHGGSDSRIVSVGVNGKKGHMQSPTVFNAVFNFSQFWNGRAKNLSEQAAGPIHNPLEMGMSTRQVEKRINGDTYYRDAFKSVTGHSAVTFSDVTSAIAEYEKTLITPNGKFDRFLRGETALDPAEAQGYELFKRLGCATCHNGINVGGNSFQKFGVITPKKWASRTDDRYAVTGRESDKNVFKVPTLRNIALTAPYFHDGSAATLEEAISAMSHHNLGIRLTSDNINNLTEFLNTLTGELPHKAIMP